jgi:hypothetical protein
MKRTIAKGVQDIGLVGRERSERDDLLVLLNYPSTD